MKLLLLLLAQIAVLVSGAARNCISANCASTSVEADIVFMVDASEAIGAANFAGVQLFLTNFVKGLSLSPVDTQLAFYTYGASAQSYLSLSTSADLSSVQNAILSMKYEGSASRNLYQIMRLRALAKQQTDVVPASGFRTTVYKHVLVVISGDTWTGNQVLGSPLLTQVQQKYDMILSVGFGTRAIANQAVDLRTLTNMPANTFYALSVDQLDYVSAWISSYSCPGIQQVTTIPVTTPLPTQSPSLPCQLSTLNYDVYLILDVSATASAADFAQMKQAVKDFVSPFPVGDGKTQFAVVATSVDSQLYFTAFHSGQSRSDVLLAVDKLLQDTNVGQTLNLALGAIQGYLSQQFPTSNKIIAYFTSNTKWDASPASTMANLKSKYNVFPVAVQWTSTASASDLATFTGSANCVNAVSNKQNAATWLQSKMCSKMFC